MKLKMKGRDAHVRLIGATRASEELLYAEAERIQRGCGDVLFTLSYARRGRRWRIEYFTGASRPLTTVLKSPLATEHFEAMLVSFREVGRACDANALSLQRVCFDERFLFFDAARYSLRFAYLPVRGSATHPSDPLRSLAHVVEQAKLSCGPVSAAAMSVLDFAKRSTVFSWPEYEALLCEQGLLDPSDGPVRSSPSACVPRCESIDRRHLFGCDLMGKGHV